LHVQFGERRRVADQVDGADPPGAGDREAERHPDLAADHPRRAGLAALPLAEAATRLADSPDPVPDEVWDEAARHYDERGLAQLVLKIAVTNLFNRLNRVTRQPAGAW
jgi:alkylhydroperoxidase family enzyme